ncbi:DUF805 domain-containing protein [Massilia pseudoviolaceinigra]|uniref:DUF805 domain-containing protein n=1 Tax=Massilia pseudoviolaceinigra TaxID=3057165 RepID=UPI0027968001|nr:DUF805 domain-containing protein [Massilia sp. CCM 9206]MDQ1920113.1 DUF805 domain-containing protein [Massilia sp. CCM 9206]
MSEAGEPAGPAHCQPHLFQTAGRIGRVRYMAYSIAPVALYLLFSFCVLYFRTDQVVDLRFPLLLLTSALLAVIASRRLRDIGLPWWLAALLFVPMAGAPAWLHWPVFAALSLLPGSELANRDGPAPCANDGLTVAAAYLWIVLFAGAAWLVLSLRESLKAM